MNMQLLQAQYNDAYPKGLRQKTPYEFEIVIGKSKPVTYKIKISKEYPQKVPKVTGEA